MLKLSLTFRLALFWISTVVVSIALAALLSDVYDQGAGALIAKGTITTQEACRELQRKFLWSAQNKSFDAKQETQFQGALLEIILDHYTAVEGGFWTKPKGFVAYAYPTYEGRGIKKDVPVAEKPSLEKVSAESIDSEKTQTQLTKGQREAMIITACPIEGASLKTAAWTLSRVPLGVGVAYDRFKVGLVLLLAFVLLTGVAVTLLLFNWSKNLRNLERAISNHPVEDLPELALTNEAELDPIVNALNGLNKKLHASREESGRLTRKLSQADRLSALGKMAAEIAHEIRNPLATMRLKFENAMVSPAERMERAAPIIMDQMVRMDRLVQMMLAMTQPFELKAQEVELKSWFESSFLSVKQKAEEKTIQLSLESEVEKWSLDPFHMGRAIENLLTNAIAFTPPQGSVYVHAVKKGHLLAIEVKDTGPGVSDEIRMRLFEPFATGRADGNGLGLVLVREIVEAHGGTIREMDCKLGACFELEIPWLKS